MANRRKPKREKEIAGTKRADRDRPEADLPVPKGKALRPPSWLVNKDATDLWKHVIGLLAPVRVLSEADLTALGHMANLHARCVRLWRAGESPTAAELTQLRLYFTEFGLTPASRSRAAPMAEETHDERSRAEKHFTGPRAVPD